MFVVYFDNQTSRFTLTFPSTPSMTPIVVPSIFNNKDIPILNSILVNSPVVEGQMNSVPVEIDIVHRDEEVPVNEGVC